ncbi:MAG TPA: DinB family protein [Dehalococcoidia bacterium]|jgi:hypothetical protein
MGNKSDALAAKFEQTSKDFQSRIEALTPQEWQAKTPEGWTVAACAHHAAISSAPLSMMASAIAGNGPMPAITPAMLDEINATHAKEFANCSKEETLAALRDSTGPAAAVVRSFSDEELAKKAMLPFGMEMSTEQMIENVLIGHMQGHSQSVATAVPA